MRLPLGDHRTCEASCSDDGGCARGTVRENTRQLRELGDPSTILLAVNFKIEISYPVDHRLVAK
jgi:hypothetical protein